MKKIPKTIILLTLTVMTLTVSGCRTAWNAYAISTWITQADPKPAEPSTFLQRTSKDPQPG